LLESNELLPQEMSASKRARVIEELLPRAERMARRIARRLPAHVRMDDLVSAGTVGLIEAVDRFNPEKCGSIERYADIRIRGAILDELRAMDWATRSLRRQASHVQDTVVQLSQELGRTPEGDEVAKALDLDLEDYHRLMKRIRPVLVLSFEEMGSSSSDGRRDALQVISDPDGIDPSAVLQDKRLKQILDVQLERMPERSRLVLSLYHFEHMTLKQIGALLGVTESRVSQILSAAVKTLRKRVQERIRKEGAQHL
jgi:RNA polymerase sigma factor FliA